MDDLRGILRTTISIGLPLGNSLYQESVQGTEGSDFIYPTVRGVYGLWNHTGRNRSNFAQNIGKVSILSGAIFFGLIKEKKVSLILAEVVLIEMTHFMTSQISKRMKPPEGNRWTPEKYRLAVVAQVVIHIGYSVLGTYLFSRRNSTLSMKPYYFSSIAFPILMGLKQLYLDQLISSRLVGIIGDGKCPDNEIYRVTVASNVLTAIVLQPILAKCATLATGESIQKNWSVQIISSALKGVTDMYL